MPRLCPVLLALALLLPAASAADQPSTDSRVRLSNWAYERMRKTAEASNHFVAELDLQNISAQPLEGVRVEIALYWGLRDEAGRLGAWVGAVRPQETKHIRAMQDFVHDFSSYQIHVTYTGGSETWLSASARSDPQWLPPKPLPGLALPCLLGHELVADKANRLAGPVRVRNLGTQEAQGLKLYVTLYDNPLAGPKKLEEQTLPLGNGKLAGGAERTFPISLVSRARSFDRFDVRLAWDVVAEHGFVPVEFQNAKDFEAAHWRFQRAGAKGADLLVSCDVRNGLERPLDWAKLTFTLVSGKGARLVAHTQCFAGPFKSGQVAPLSFTVPRAPEFDNYESAWVYGDGIPPKDQ